MKNYIVIICLLLPYFTFGQQQLSTKEAQAFKERIEKETKALKSVRTNFEQNKHLSFLSKEIASAGKMYLNQEGNLKWEYTSPNKYSVIFKNNAIYINDNGKKSTVSGKNDVFKNINHLISGSINGKLFNDDEFSVQYFKNGKTIIAELIPLDKTIKKYIQQVKLYFEDQDPIVSKVKLIEPSGDFTEILFINKETNVPIDAKIFIP